MPFQSPKQRRYMHANLPEIANRWEAKYGLGGIAELNAQLNSLPEYYLPKNQGGLIPSHEAGIYGLAEGGQLVKPGPGRPGYGGPHETEAAGRAIMLTDSLHPKVLEAKDIKMYIKLGQSHKHLEEEQHQEK